MERNAKWDFYRGLLIWGVVIGHMITALKSGDSSYVWLHTFLRMYDMPMFAFISGYFIYNGLGKHTLKQGIVRRIQTILIPTIIWNVIINVLTRNMNLYLWYLWSICFCNILVFSIAKTSKNKIVTFFLFTFFLIIFHTGIGGKLNIGFLLFPCIVGFYYATLEKNGIGRIKSYSLYIVSASVMVMFVVMACFWKAEYSVWNIGTNIFESTRNCLLILYRGIIGCFGSISMMLVFSKVYNIIKNKKIVVEICRWGGTTLELYILQTIFVEIILGKMVSILIIRLGYNPFVQNCSVLGFVIAPLLSLATLYILYRIQYSIKKIPIIGKYAFRLG